MHLKGELSQAYYALTKMNIIQSGHSECPDERQCPGIQGKVEVPTHVRMARKQRTPEGPRIASTGKERGRPQSIRDKVVHY